MAIWVLIVPPFEAATGGGYYAALLVTFANNVNAGVAVFHHGSLQFINSSKKVSSISQGASEYHKKRTKQARKLLQWE